MSEQTKAIIATTAGAVVVFGGILVVGRVLMNGHGAQGLTYSQAIAANKESPDPTVFKTVIGKVTTAGVNLPEMFDAAPQALARGKTVFATSCVACHGMTGQGNGPVAAALKPPPRNFTSPRGWTRGYTIADIYETLTAGIPKTAMGSFGTLSVADRFALAHYVQSLGHFNHHDDKAAEINRLEVEYHFSGGTRTPNKVAVPIVMEHMAAEYRAPQAVRMPPVLDDSLGARLCRRLIADPQRAAAVLALVPGWRENLNLFAGVVMADAPRNGFEPAAATLDRSQWLSFHAELAKLAAEAPRPKGTAE